MKKKFLLKTMLLLCALIAGSSSVWAQTSYEELFTIKSSDVVSNSSYAAYNTTVDKRGFVITFGGNNKSVGTNSNNRSNCTLSSYSNYAVSPVTTSSIASAFACTTSISDVSKISYTIDGGSNQTNTNVYLLYSSDNSSFSQVTLTSGTQGATISSGTAYEFEAKTGYFALLFEATNSSGNWRIDDVDVTFYKEASGGSDPSISASNVNIAQDATNGSIAYTLNNATGNVSASITSGDWLELGTITASAVPFTCSANTGAERTAQVTLSFSGATDKVVTITQAAKTVTKPEFNLDGGSYFQGTTFTLTSEGNTIYYTTDGSTPTGSSTEYTAPLAIAVGKITYKAIAKDTYGNFSNVVSCTYTGVSPATLPFVWDKKETSTTGVISTSVGTYDGSPYLKFDTTNDNLILKFDGVPGTLAFDIKGNSFSGGTFKVQTSVDGETYSNLKEYTSLSDKTTECFTTLANTVRYIKWIYTYKSSGNVALGNIRLISPVTISAYEWATYVTPCALDFTGLAVKAYAVTGHSGSALTLSDALTTVPANTPLLLNGPADTYTVPIAASASPIGTNKLVAGTGDAISAVDGKTRYVLSINNNGTDADDSDDFAEFQKIVGTPATVPVGKAYLEFDGDISAPSLSFDFNNSTGIENVNRETITNNRYFNLNGQRVAQPTKGLYIVNGKKVIVK